MRSLVKGGKLFDQVKSGGLCLLRAAVLALANIEATSDVVLRADDEDILRILRRAPVRTPPEVPILARRHRPRRHANRLTAVRSQ